MLEFYNRIYDNRHELGYNIDGIVYKINNLQLQDRLASIWKTTKRRKLTASMHNEHNVVIPPCSGLLYSHYGTSSFPKSSHMNTKNERSLEQPYFKYFYAYALTTSLQLRSLDYPARQTILRRCIRHSFQRLPLNTS
uniref:NAD-dependent DNA ligase adenylation domain-containing protein n=1 Tax=Glossina brevipalpis TaxID=37001 RepID=A0A1A9WUX5_9MUSC